MLLKLADLLDTSKIDAAEDDDFEDCDDMQDDEAEEEKEAQVIDLDAQKQACLIAVFGYLDHVLLRTQPIP